LFKKFTLEVDLLGNKLNSYCNLSPSKGFNDFQQEALKKHSP